MLLYENLIDYTEPSPSSEKKYCFLILNMVGLKSLANNIDRDDEIITNKTRGLSFLASFALFEVYEYTSWTNHKWITVHFIEVCQRLFSDNFVYYLLFLAETFMMSVNVFYITMNKISVGSDKKWEISPKTPIIKIAHFCNVMSIDIMLPKWAIFTMEVYGKILCLLSDQAEILFLVI